MQMSGSCLTATQPSLKSLHHHHHPSSPPQESLDAEQFQGLTSPDPTASRHFSRACLSDNSSRTYEWREHASYPICTNPGNPKGAALLSTSPEGGGLILPFREAIRRSRGVLGIASVGAHPHMASPLGNPRRIKMQKPSWA